MHIEPITKRRVVIVDDSRTMQAVLENAFGDRADFNVVGVAGDARTGADLITLLRPDIATIDLCMPYIDGIGLLEMINRPFGTCAITVSDQTTKNIALTKRLKEVGAFACLSKSELADNPASFFDKLNSANGQFCVDQQAQIQAIGSKSKSVKPVSSQVVPTVVDFGFPVPPDERRRLQLLKNAKLANAVRERQFDLVTKHLAAMTGYPVCLLTFIDRETQWHKSVVGLDSVSTPREQAFCNYTISQGGSFVVADATEDSRFATNPLVTGGPQIRSYAGHAIVTGDGTKIGSLCLVDNRPRVVSIGVLRQLAGMAEIVSEMIEQRLLKAA